MTVGGERRHEPSSERLVFASPEWFDELFSYLREREAELVAGCDERPFSLCEVITQAPFDAGPGAPLSWWLRVGPDGVSTGSGVVHDVDHASTATYEEAYAQAVSPSSAVVERALELARSGHAPPAIPSGVGRVLLALHDHMAAVTAELQTPLQ